MLNKSLKVNPIAKTPRIFVGPKITNHIVGAPSSPDIINISFFGILAFLCLSLFNRLDCVKVAAM